MYAALWRILPGPIWVKVVQALILGAGIVALLFAVVFPYVADVFFTEPSTLSP